MNIFKIAFANIRKRKGTSITFLVMVLLAALMLAMSLSLMIGLDGFYENKVNELNAPHYSIFVQKNNSEFKTFAENEPGVTDVATVSAIFNTGKWKMKSGAKTDTVVFLNAGEMEQNNVFYNPPIIDKQQGEMAEDSIVLPITYKFDGFKSGEEITLDLDGTLLKFKIYGFYEDALMGSSTSTLTLAFLDSQIFNTLQTGGSFMNCTGLMVRFEKSSMHTAFATAFRKHISLDESEIIFMVEYSESEMGATMFMNIVSMFLVVFSVIMLVITFIVVVFSINSSIAEDISNIGALKSIGYRNNALRGSQLMQYVFIAIIGTVLGSLVSLVVFGALGNIIASTSGLLWLSSTNFIPAVVSIIAICGLTLLITFFATRKYKKITPIAALRQGGSQKTSTRNKMPLDKGKMPLNVHLGFKRFLNSIWNNVNLGVTVMLLVFVSLLVFVMSYNMNIDRTAMINMVGLEMSDIYLQVNPDSPYTIKDVRDALEDMNGAFNSHGEVNRTMLSGSKFCYMFDDENNRQNEHETFVYTVEDYSKLTINTVVKGRNPEKDNEIALASLTANQTKKKLGDKIKLDIDGIIEEYTVVGITQNIANGGEGCHITEKAMSLQAPGFKMNQIYIYLNPGVDTEQFINSLAATYEKKYVVAMDVNEAMDNILSSMGDPLQAVSAIMIIMTLIIIAFVLFLITTALIRKNKKEFGIMKAIGYRNKALILQLFLSLLPALVIGTILGVLLGFFISNPLLSIFFSSAGLLKTYFIIPVGVSLLISLAVLAASLGITYLISFRLRKISPQKLIVAQ